MNDKNEKSNGSIYLFQYVLDEKARIVRDELYEYFILKTLYEKAKDSSLTKDEIQKSIKNDYNFEKFPQLHFDESFSRVLKKKKIIGKDTFSLSADVKTEINQNNQNYIKLMTNVQNDLKNQILEKTPNVSIGDAERISNNFFKLLGRIFSIHGKEIAKIIINQNSDMKNLETFEGFRDEYKELILKVAPSGTHSKLSEIFNDFLFNSNDNQSKFIFVLAQGHTLLEVLNVDPDLQKYQEGVLKKTRIYLDTNVIINILFKNGVHAESLRSIIQQSQELGTVFVMNEITKKEFDKWLESNKKEVAQIRNIPKKYADLLFDKNIDAPLLMAYLTSLRDNPHQTIDQFCLGYEDISKNLKNEYHIEYDDSNISKFKKHQKFSKLARLVHETNQSKLPPTIQHDTLCILKTKELRKENPSGPIGPRIWFLTTDTTLWRAEKKIFLDKDIRASITATVWMQIISPLISPKLKSTNITKSFSRLLSTNFSSDSIIKQEDILNISAACLDDKGLSPEEFEGLLGDKQVRNTLKKLHSAQIEQNKEEEEKWTREGMRAISNRLNDKNEKEIVQTKIKLAETQIQENNRKIKNYETYLAGYEKKLKQILC